MLMTSTGLSLHRFLPRRRPLPLLEGQVRYVTEIQSQGASVKRVCVADSAGDSWVEFPRRQGQYGIEHPVLHLCCDQGSVGRASALWLAGHEGLRCSLTWDPCHRHHNNYNLAVVSTGLVEIRCELKVITKVRHGFWAGQKSLAIMKAAAEEFFQGHTASNPLFESLFADILLDNPDLSKHPSPGSEDHMQQVWLWARQQMLSSGLGEKVELSRWFSFEAASRAMMHLRWVLCMVLVFLGLKKGWVVEEHLTQPSLLSGCSSQSCRS